MVMAVRHLFKIMQQLVSPGNCCVPCSETVNIAVPGPAGANGTDGADGSAGRNAYGLLASPFVQPAVNATVIATVDSSTWAAIYMDIYQESGGYYQVVGIPDATHITLKNRGYDANSPPGSIIPSGSRITPAGEKGETGDVDTNGALMQSSNLSDLDNSDTALTNLGADDVGAAIFKISNPSAITFLRVNADNSVDLLSAADFKTALSLTPGVDIQAYDALLTSLASLGTAADKMFYTTGVNTVAETALTTLARSLLAGATVSAMRSTLGNVLPRYGLLASKTAMDVNSAASDNAMTVEATRYRIDRVVFDNASINLTTATAGIFTAAGGGGTTVAADQALSALTATTKFDDLTLGGSVATDVLTAATLYARCGTAQGAAATVNVFVFGWVLQ